MQIERQRQMNLLLATRRAASALQSKPSSPSSMHMSSQPGRRADPVSHWRQESGVGKRERERSNLQLCLRKWARQSVRECYFDIAELIAKSRSMYVVNLCPLRAESIVIVMGGTAIENMCIW